VLEMELHVLERYPFFYAPRGGWVEVRKAAQNRLVLQGGDHSVCPDTSSGLFELESKQ
jgi:hypothetical protein